MASIFTGEMWNGVVPLIGVSIFLLILAWWIIEGTIIGIRFLRNDWRHEE